MNRSDTDPAVPPPRVLSSRPVYEGKIVSLRVDEIELPCSDLTQKSAKSLTL